MNYIINTAPTQAKLLRNALDQEIMGCLACVVVFTPLRHDNRDEETSHFIFSRS